MNRLHFPLKLVIMAVIILLLIPFLNLPHADGLNISNNNTNAIITSRFILWDTDEKMIDNSFQIHLYSMNETNNYTAAYDITINEQIYYGNFTHYYQQNFTLNNTETIALLQINIDNETIIKAENIIVIRGISANEIKRTASSFLIELSPFEWRAKQWNIFFAFIISFIYGIYPSYKLVMYYRKYRGVSQIK